MQNKSPVLELLEPVLRERLVNGSITISYPELIEVTGISRRSLARATKYLRDSGNWDITKGIGHSKTTFTYLGR